MSNTNGILYIVATPIGNLSDISLRGLEVLGSVSLIAAEDTRNSKVLLNHHSIQTPMTAYHEHNEDRKTAFLLDKLTAGESIALISDAGTPLINDPGYSLVEKATQAGIQVMPIPGACAIIAALSASGIATDRFSFEGFLPRTSGARQTVFEDYQKRQGTLIFYESSHRIAKCMDDVLAVYQPTHRMSIARELTKTYETIVTGTVEAVHTLVMSDSNMQRGEFVVLIEGFDKKQHKDDGLSTEDLEVLKTLMGECSVKTAVKLAVQLTGQSKKLLYTTALALNNAD
ncbi:MAG TPA: 16S rRNA (cytidine(1402)-2'-O)-methyltransferase [Cycloclasticus sp.]|jgi:16S rRNA (cytidine1402-2'-O)-methyltransferase|nr:16S rRNA (cytidine(1402)-2'-O)-methyltransferase [Cycloclasticus sp.]HIL93175.1 16S rRNA (cytidine(1402)-2'-O)-methyltransferase [Cycloclasticus sp.]